MLRDKCDWITVMQFNQLKFNRYHCLMKFIKTHWYIKILSVLKQLGQLF
jgi:hypothetical protein